MKALVIYDTTGKIWSIIYGEQKAPQGLLSMQSNLSNTKLDDIKLDTDTNMIYGTSGGVKQGKGIKLQDLGDAIADNTADGMVYVNTFDDEEGDG